jgi:hypothetical protein
MFLKLEETSKFGRTCFHINNCYRFLWFSGEYFTNICTENYTENELALICQKYKLNYCGILKEMMRGKSVNSFLNRNKVTFKITEHMKKSGGYYYEKFDIGPGKNTSLQPFFTDETFEQLVETSYRSLQILSIRNCFLLTHRAFSYIPRIPNLIALQITASRNLTDNHIIDMIDSCRILGDINLAKCSQLTEKALIHILTNSFCLERLDISHNRGMFQDFTGFNLFKKRVMLRYLNLSHTALGRNDILSIVAAVPNLEEIVLEGFFIRIRFRGQGISAGNMQCAGIEPD